MSAKVHKTAVVDDNIELGADVEIGPGCVIGPNVKLGDGTKLIAHVFIESHTELGKNNTVFPFVGLGGAPKICRIEESRPSSSSATTMSSASTPPFTVAPRVAVLSPPSAMTV